MNPAEPVLQELRNQVLIQLRRKGLSASESEEVFQNAALKAIESIDTVRNADKIENWFRVVLRNELNDHFRSRQKEQRLRDEALLQAEIPQTDEAESAFCACGIQLLGSLGPDYRSALEAVVLEELSIREAAAKLGVSENLVKVRIHRAKAAMKVELEKSCGMKTLADGADCDC
jgi:RNA polymerase sigma factor (sigma-70 family)